MNSKYILVTIKLLLSVPYLFKWHGEGCIRNCITILDSGGEVESLFYLTPDWFGIVLRFCVNPSLHFVMGLRSREEVAGKVLEYWNMNSVNLGFVGVVLGDWFLYFGISIHPRKDVGTR